MANAKPKKPEKTTCSICGLPKAKSNYYTSTRKEYQISNDGYCPICKKCLSDMLIDLDTHTITVASFKKVLSYLDMVYIPSLFTEVSLQENVNANNFIGLYKKSLNLKKEWKNLKFADSPMFEVEHAIKKNETRKELLFEITDDIKLFWGNDLPPEDYKFLQQNFDRFTVNEKNMDYKKESDYKTLCVYELQKSKIQYDLSKVADVQKLQGLIDNLSNNLGIQAIQKKNDEQNDRFTLGLIARYHEDVKKKPIRRWVEDLGNKDMIDKTIKTYYLGGILQAMQINNPNIEQYRKEVEQFTVKLDEILEEKDEENG